MGCRRKNTLCLSLDFGANDGTLLPSLTRLETSPLPQKRLVLKFPKVLAAEPPEASGEAVRNRYFKVPFSTLLAASPLACPALPPPQNFISRALTIPPAMQAISKQELSNNLTIRNPQRELSKYSSGV